MLTVTDISFTKDSDWLYELVDSHKNVFFIMGDNFYKSHKLRSPITKHELDYLAKGEVIHCITQEIDGLNVVVKIR